ncbi:MAG: NapC/NirT family cytochrome c [Dehalococcoidia bacterium]|nr:NapC/NirT family cytochrome c [Dehalococcoidia bacterium]
MKLFLGFLSGLISVLVWIGSAVAGWRSLPLLVRAATLAVAVVVVVSIGYGSLQVYSYTQNDPNFCRSCHTMETAWQRWRTSEHRNVNCHSCHEQSPIESSQLVVLYALSQPDRVSKHAGISDESCMKCHGNGKSRWFQIGATPGHKVHFEEQRISCVKCHSITIHRFAPSTEICKVCHSEQKVKITNMGQRYCLDCHQFLREDSPLRPTRQTCLDCHLKQAQTKVHWPDNAPMQFQCSQCHKPHISEAPEANCLSCHKDIPKTGLHEKPPHAATNCQACHQPHEWKVEKRETCQTCHANKVNHNQGVLCSNCHGFKK